MSTITYNGSDYKPRKMLTPGQISCGTCWNNATWELPTGTSGQWTFYYFYCNNCVGHETARHTPLNK
jgi:hypothetical protein